MISTSGGMLEDGRIDLGEDRIVIIVERELKELAAEMPVARVQNPHAVIPSIFYACRN
ncbi:hypothetical protein [Sphingomonas sp. Ant20]|uniref:hypothetical protein n=1 Tax=Sphingomonas sp. Ant20 TaxID=104605 RepID=UPI0018E32150|nr:hypothetical protein [Sphingomonas sp. Ant20]